MLTFDLDCGEAVPGRHLHLRGLRADGTWPDGTPRVFLGFEIVPAVAVDDADAEHWCASPVADVEFSTSPPLTWDAGRYGDVGGGGSISGGPGEPYAHGSYGPYPLPEGVRELLFEVTAYADRRRDGPGEADVVITPATAPLGVAVLDVRAGTARWEPRQG